ncbi:chaplin family protein [Kitasatospora sp. NPDC096147]|uniref:chaplin family protein n=1 Tax=Kitasatospora sp. NPDC096147 TaxID=3364093 RepID=UPI00382DA09B
MRQVAKKGIFTVVATGSVLASASGYAYAGADAQGVTSNSPGVGSGNSLQAPVDIPVNACGNTVSVVGLLNPAMGNDCANSSGGSRPGGGAHHDGPSTKSGGAHSAGTTANSPGIASGNSVHAPVSIPVNACGNSVDVVGIANPAFGNNCANVATPPPPATPDDECEEHGTHNPPPPATTQPPGTPGGSGTGGHGNGRGGLPGAELPGTGTVTAKPVSYTETPPPAPAPAAARTAAPAAVAAPARAQLAQTGSEGLQLMTVTGAALLLGGGVLYRRSRAGAR